MEGVDLKKVARAKRASSQRSRAGHSRHAVVSAGAGEKTVAEDLLPSNWKRYGDGSSDEDAAPQGEGEVRPKSKGADYSELLSLEMPKLYDEPPELWDVTAMLLANGLGLLDWDVSYLEPPSSTSERQASRDASALLTVDLMKLGKSISCLNVAERLFLEDELFPKQRHVEDKVEKTDMTHTILGFESVVPAADGWTELSDESDLANYADVLPKEIVDSSPLGHAKSPSVSTVDRVTISSLADKSIKEAEKEEIQTQKSTELFGSKRFEATAAEAELDDLLDMLDNQTTPIPLGKGGSDHISTGPISGSFTQLYPSRRLSNSGFQEPWLESRPGKWTPKSDFVVPSQSLTLASASTKEVRESIPSSDAKGNDVLVAEEDDFHSWLDSI